MIFLFIYLKIFHLEVFFFFTKNNEITELLLSDLCGFYIILLWQRNIML